MKRFLLCLSLFAFFGSQAQQINPVPDYVFSNKMSVGRNAVTDTAAYFSIGPRYGAIRGMMPPMVTDTASMSATKRNGLLIFSIQKNKYLYWDSVGAKWAEMAGTAGSAITGSGVAGYMPEFTTSTNLDTTRLYHSAGRFAIGSTTTTNGVFNVYGGQAYFDTSLKVGTQTLFADEGKNEVYVNTTSDAGAYALQVAGAMYNTTDAFFSISSGEVYIGTTTDAGNYKLQVNGDAKFNGIDITTLDLNTSGQRYRFSTRYGANSDGKNIWIGDGGNSSIGQAGQTFRGSQNTSVGVNAMSAATTGYDNTAIGVSALQFLTIGYNNMAMGGFALRNLSSGYSNIGIGYLAGTNLTIGNQNIAIGQDALRFTNSGTTVDSVTNSIYVGHDSRPSAKTNTNEIVIGYQGRGNGSNTVTIGNSSTTDNYFTGSIRTSAPSGGSIKPWKIGEAATVSPTSPNRTIRVEIDGTVYYLHAKTTND